MQLRSSDEQLYELSDAAARQSVTLQGAKVVGDDAVPLPFDSGRLQRITVLLEQTAVAFGLEGMADEHRDALLKDGLSRGGMGAQLHAATATVLEGVDGLADVATLLLDLKWFDAPLLTSVLAEGVARLLKGKSADALRTLLEANDDLGDQEKEAALREPLFAPPAAAPAAAAPPPLTGVLLAMDGDTDAELVALERCDAQTLRQLKAVSAGWQQRARRVLRERLLDRLCSRQSPRPKCLDEVEELDVEELPHEAVAAVRSVPNLARLRGYGFRVELKGPQGVEQAALGRADSMYSLSSLRKALRSCIHEGEGKPPHRLLLAAVACAARGTVLGVPVQRLREDDTIGSLDLGQNTTFSKINAMGAELLGLMLPAATSVRKLNLSCNCLTNFGDDMSGLLKLLEILPQTKIETLGLANNKLCGSVSRNGTYTTEGITKLCEGLKGSAVTSLNLGGNQLCGLYRDSNGRITAGTYTAEGITKLFEGLKGSAVTSLRLSSNEVKDNGAVALSAVLKDTKITSLDLRSNDIGDKGASALAAVLKETHITTLNLERNQLGPEGGAAIAEDLKGNSTLQSLNLGYNKLCGFNAAHSYSAKDYTTEGITMLCKGLMRSAVTLLDLKGNRLYYEGGAALAEGLKGNSTLRSLDIGNTVFGDKGAIALAAVLEETQITNLGFHANLIGHKAGKGASALAAILKQTQITSIDLRSSDLSYEAKQAFKDAAGSSVRIIF